MKSGSNKAAESDYEKTLGSQESPGTGSKYILRFHLIGVKNFSSRGRSDAIKDEWRCQKTFQHNLQKDNRLD